MFLLLNTPTFCIQPRTVPGTFRVHKAGAAQQLRGRVPLRRAQGGPRAARQACRAVCRVHLPRLPGRVRADTAVGAAQERRDEEAGVRRARLLLRAVGCGVGAEGGLGAGQVQAHLQVFYSAVLCESGGGG